MLSDSKECLQDECAASSDSQSSGVSALLKFFDESKTFCHQAIVIREFIYLIYFRESSSKNYRCYFKANARIC